MLVVMKLFIVNDVGIIENVNRWKFMLYSELRVFVYMLMLSVVKVMFWVGMNLKLF